MGEKIEVYKNGKLIHEGDDRRLEGGAKGFTIRYELLGIIGLMFVQFVGAVWWASSISKDVAHVAKSLETLAVVVGQAADKSVAQFDNVNKTMLNHESRIVRLESRGS